jgi:hypothetical protein
MRVRLAAVAVLVLCSASARADVPDAATLAAAVGVSADQLASARAGEIVSGSAKASNERELTATLLFLVPKTEPAALAALGQKGLVDRVDANVTRSGVVDATASPASFAQLALAPDQQRIWASAAPGSALNVSSGEVGALAGAANVQQAVVALLAQRVSAYRAQGLAGIAPYARGGGATRSAADDLRSATQAAEALRKYAPNAYAFLLGYPQGRPEGTQEIVRWSQISAHDVPTIVLTQTLWIPDGGAWIATQRQFYVSTGYNCEQAIAAFLPVAEGTLVFYVNRTSTDQVTGFGGGMKRDIGSRLLESTLQELFEKARQKAAPGE